MATKKAVKKAASKSMPASGKNPKGGLTAEGRAFFKKTEGANLKPGVKGAADTPEKMKRKGSFLTRHFTHPRGPMVDAKGQPTRLALSAHCLGRGRAEDGGGGKEAGGEGEKAARDVPCGERQGGEDNSEEERSEKRGEEGEGIGETASRILLGVASATIRVHLVSFGPLKRLFREGGEWRECVGGESVGGLLSSLRDEGTLDEAAMGSVAVAVNEEYARPAQILQDGDRVAILPPVSGGVDAVALVREPIDADGIMRAMKAGADGAVCVFDGIVRDNTRGRRTLHLDYEAYEEMALRQMKMLRAEAMEQFGVREVTIVHRLGRLTVGETSVLIVVASAHRGAAFEACRWVIDTLKKTVPVWKKEQFVDGAVWADGEAFPDEMAGTR